MKKIISILILISLLSSLSVYISAEECSHNWISETLEANCSNYERIKSTCSKCGIVSYKDVCDVSTPDSFSMIIKSERVDNKLTVKGYLYNNPGIVAARLTVTYSSDVLTLDSFTNGSVWSDDEYPGGINPQDGKIVLYTENANLMVPNVNNGLYFTMAFTIKNDGDYNFKVTSGQKDINGLDTSSYKILYYPLTYINVVGKNEYGNHSYGEWTVVNNSTLDNPGCENATCIYCGNIIEREIPILEHWIKGDLNNDSKVNAIDVNMMIKLIATGTTDIQMQDAADLNNDGHVNAVDSNLMLKAITGGV